MLNLWQNAYHALEPFTKQSTLEYNLYPDQRTRDNKTMNRSGGFSRFWDGEFNPATRLS